MDPVFVLFLPLLSTGFTTLAAYARLVARDHWFRFPQRSALPSTLFTKEALHHQLCGECSHLAAVVALLLSLPDVHDALKSKQDLQEHAP